MSRLIERLTTGDVIYTNCVGVPFCYHLGIVVDYGNKKRIFHNSPYIKNRYGGSICSEPYDAFMKEREIMKIVRTNVSREQIEKASRKCKKVVWDTFFFNCEDYILEVVEGRRRSDLRDAWKISALGIAIITLL
jgi:hypothetical protein